MKINEEQSEILYNNIKNEKKQIDLELQDYKSRLEANNKEKKIQEEKINQLLEQNKQDKEKIEELLKKEEENEKSNINLSNIVNDISNDKSKLILKLYDQQSEDYKKELEKIKNKFNKELNEKFKNKINNDDDDKYKNIYKEINEQSKLLLNNYLGKLEELENKRKNEFETIMNTNNDNNVIKFSINEAIHEGIKCNNCSKKPIIGERYQCSQCPNYNLCKNCEEENSITLKHNHNFIKIRYANNNDIIEKKDDKKIVNENKNYSFEIENKKEEYLLYVGTFKYDIELTIRNNCKYAYPENTEIICDKDSNLIPTNKIKINKLKPNETQNITIKYDNLKACTQGIMNSFFNFEVNGKKFGIKIIIKLKFLANDNYELVELFRREVHYNLEKWDNKKIIKKLKRNRCNFNDTLDDILRDEKK